MRRSCRAQRSSLGVGSVRAGRRRHCIPESSKQAGRQARTHAAAQPRHDRAGHAREAAGATLTSHIQVSFVQGACLEGRVKVAKHGTGQERRGLSVSRHKTQRRASRAGKMRVCTRSALQQGETAHRQSCLLHPLAARCTPPALGPGQQQSALGGSGVGRCAPCGLAGTAILFEIWLDKHQLWAEARRNESRHGAAGGARVGGGRACTGGELQAVAEAVYPGVAL